MPSFFIEYWFNKPLTLTADVEAETKEEAIEKFKEMTKDKCIKIYPPISGVWDLKIKHVTKFNKKK